MCTKVLDVVVSSNPRTEPETAKTTINLKFHLKVTFGHFE